MPVFLRWVLAGLGLLFGTAWLAVAEVKVEVREDGTTVIYNEAPGQRERRLATRLLPVPDPEIAEWVRAHAEIARLDPRLVQAVVQVESGYNRWAVSRKGALGLMQLMPATAELVGVEDVFDPAQNIAAGTTYLRSLLDRFDGRVELALAGYNAGPETVERHGGVPPYRETRDYVRRVFQLWKGDGSLPEERRPEVRILRDEQDRLVITTEPEPRR